MNKLNNMAYLAPPGEPLVLYLGGERPWTSVDNISLSDDTGSRLLCSVFSKFELRPVLFFLSDG
jgi:hypothetical protein